MTEQTTQQERDELDALTGGPVRTLHLAGADLEITPLVTRELPAMLNAMQPIIGLFAQTPEAALQTALISHPDAVINAVAIAARRPREWVDALPLDDLIELAGTVIEVNVDFFARRLVPMIQRTEARLTAALAGSSSPPA
jgi:hypothetical protein